MYVWQMNDGRWHISNFTSVEYDWRMGELANGYDTRAEADKALNQWRARYPDAVKPAWPNSY